MARHHDRDRVGPVGGAHRAHRPRRADRFRDLAVAPRLPIRDALQFAPHAQLESRAPHIQRQVEPPQLPGEIGPQLARGLGGDGVTPGAAALRRTRKVEVNGAQPEIACNKTQGQAIYHCNLGTFEHALSLSQATRCCFLALCRQPPPSRTCYNWSQLPLCLLSLSHLITARIRRSFCSSPVASAPVSSGRSMWSRSLSTFTVRRCTSARKSCTTTTWSRSCALPVRCL